MMSDLERELRQEQAALEKEIQHEIGKGKSEHRKMFMQFIKEYEDKLLKETLRTDEEFY